MSTFLAGTNGPTIAMTPAGRFRFRIANFGPRQSHPGVQIQGLHVWGLQTQRVQVHGLQSGRTLVAIAT